MEDIYYCPRAELDEKLHHSIVNQFNLGTVIKTKDLGGAYNLNMLLETSSGKYVARVYRPWVTYERLSTLQKVKRTLHDNSFPVPVPLMAFTGETILHYKDRLVEVEPFIEHDSVTESWERYVIAFSLLARLHDVFASKLDSSSIIPPLVSNYGTPDVLLDWTRRAKYRIGQSAADETSKAALALCDKTIQLLSTMQVQWDKIGKNLLRQLIHGDYGIGNVLFREERVVGILDFDFLAVRERVYDLAYTLYWMFRRLESELLSQQFAWSRVKEMLVCYNNATSRPLTQEEIWSLPLEMARIPLYWVAEAHVLPNPAQIILQLADTIFYSRWVLEHREELANLFCS